MLGWIINLARPDLSRSELRSAAYRPAFYFEDGVPCFEVWYWCAAVARYFVMSYHADPEQLRAGVVYFTPDETPAEIQRRILAIDPTVTFTTVH